MRDQPSPNIGVSHLPVPHVARKPSGAACDPAELVMVDDEAHESRLDGAGHAPAHRILDGRSPAEKPPRHPRSREINFRADPNRGALVDVEAFGLARDQGDDLDGACAGPDDRDALAIEIYRVIPSRRAKHRSLELFAPLDPGLLGVTNSAPA